MILKLSLFSFTWIFCSCVVLDRQSAPVTFHNFQVPLVTLAKSKPIIYTQRVYLHNALRGTTIVLIDDNDTAQKVDEHHWIAPLDRIMTEAIASNIANLSGLFTTTTLPNERHISILPTIDAMRIISPHNTETNTDTTTLSSQNKYQLKEAEMVVTFEIIMTDTKKYYFTTQHLTRITGTEIESYVKAQSNNLKHICQKLARKLNHLQQGL